MVSENGTKQPEVHIGDASSRLLADDELNPRHAKGAPASASSKKKGIRRLLTVLIVVLVLVAACAFGFYIWQTMSIHQDALERQDVPEPATPDTTTEAKQATELPDNPIDFASLQAENPDAYAWIYIPDTNINLPVYQSISDDNLYLRHSADGSYSIPGEIFSQSVNSRDFSDPVTVLYGHNIQEDDSMFATLHYFENADFFNSHDVFYIYTPRHILTYNVVSAYQYDNRHIMNSFDFQNEAVVRDYFDLIQDPDSLVRNVREGMTLADDDKVVQLSTCTDDGDHSKRYLVTGVLVDDTITK